MTEFATRRSRKTRNCSSNRFGRHPTTPTGAVILLVLWLGSLCGQIHGQPAENTDLARSIEELQRLARTSSRETSISTTDGRRLNLAKEILEADSTNVVALTELGIHHAANYHWYANFIAAKEPLGGGLKDKASREFTAAYRYLDEALLRDPEAVDTYRELIRLLIQEDAFDDAADVAERLTNHRSDLADGWALRGLVAELQQQPEKAAYFFDRAVSNMTGPRQQEFASPELFLSEKRRPERETEPQSFDTAFWFERDPLYLTDENERLTSHFARKVYTDLQYGSASVDGSNTERGQIIMRYGFPAADFTFTGAISRFNVLDFGDFEFVFEDQTRGGHFTLYSPKAGVGSSWNSDYVIQAGEMKLALPERFTFFDMAKTPVEASVAMFRGRDQSTDVYIQYTVPAKHAGRPGLDTDPRSQVGGFVTSPEGRIVKRSRTQITGNAVFFGLRPFVQGVFEFQLKPGTYGTSVEYLNFDRTAYGALRDTVTIEPWESAGIELSDLIVASHVDAASESDAPDPGSIVRHGYVITPDPWSRIRQGGDAMIYFEVYGLEGSTDGSSSYRIEARVRPSESGGFLKSLLSMFGERPGKGVTASFEARSKSSHDYRWFAIDLSALKPADYDLTVEVLDQQSGLRDAKTVTLSISE